MKDRRTVTFALGTVAIYLFTVLTIQVIASDEIIEPGDFPDSCPDGSLNCAMIGPHSYRSGGLTELRFESNLDSVMEEAGQWLDSEPRTAVIGDWPGHTHAVFRSLMWRFPDDFLINGFCDEGETVIHVYSESRLGISDLGVNKDRIERFADHMSGVEMATSECSEA
ncbi:MAG: DUF1499 domain-containing protein [Candidatus Thalassarchaeaceae archaeon]|jgi:uncharacterized protein (DUF1499 family)|nr:DUF1499 domain-containing protein [Candidatus Thalassarchaeaceae archaeon]